MTPADLNGLLVGIGTTLIGIGACGALVVSCLTLRQSRANHAVALRTERNTNGLNAALQARIDTREVADAQARLAEAHGVDRV